MAEVRSALESYISRAGDAPEDNPLESMLEATDLAAARTFAKDNPASAEGLARVVGCLLVAGVEQSEVLDAVKTIASRAPKDREGNDVALLAGQLFWHLGGQPQLGEPYYRRVRRSDASNPQVLAFYRTLFSEPKDASQLMQVLAQARRDSSDGEARFALAQEMAQLARERLGSVDRAIEVWRTVLREGGADPRAVDELEALYRDAGKWTALVGLLKDAYERLPTDDGHRQERIAALSRIADLYRDQLKLEAMVLATLQRILEIDPRHESTLEALAETYAAAQRHNELLGVYDRLIAAAREADNTEREVRLLRKCASVWLDGLGNPQRALEPLRAALELAPEDDEALAMVAKIYERRGDWRALIGLRRRQLEGCTGEDALAKRLELARLSEDKLGERREAISDWNAVLEHHGEVDEALVALSRLYERESRWAELAEVLYRRVAASGDTSDAIARLTTLGRLYTERLEDQPSAIAAWAELLKRDPGNDKATRELRDAYVRLSRWDDLTRLYLEQGQPEKLVDVLQRAADRVPGVEERVELYRRVASLCNDKLSQPERAVKALERTLAIQPENYAVARELLPIYREQGNWARLMSVYERLLEAAANDDERLSCVDALHQIAAKELSSPALTFHWSLRAYQLAPTDPARRDLAVSDCEVSDGWDELSVALAARADHDEASREEKLWLYEKLALVARDKLGKPDDAQRFFRRLVELEPTREDALAALEAIYSATRRFDELADVYARRLSITAEDDPDYVATQRRLARLREVELGELDKAVAAYQAILARREDDADALDALARIHRNRGEWEALVSVLTRMHELAPDGGAKVELLFELSSVRATRLLESSRAVEGLLEVVAAAPDHRRAVVALEEIRRGDPSTSIAVMRGLLPYYQRVEDRSREAEAIEVLVEAEEDVETRRRFNRQLAGLYERMADRKLDALRIQCQLFEDQPHDWDTRQTLQRLGVELSEMEQVVGRYEVVLSSLAAKVAAADAEGLTLDRSFTTMRRDLSLELAHMLRTHLSRNRDAERVYAEILEQDETHQVAYEALAELLIAREGSSELFNLYRRRVDAIFSQREQRQLLSRMVEIARDVLGDADLAIRTAEELVDLIPDDLPTIERLAGMYEQRDDERSRTQLEDLLGRWAELIDDRSVRHELTCRRAQLRMQYLGDASGAVDLLGGVLGDNAEHVKCRELLEELLEVSDVQLAVAALLEPLYVARGEHDRRIRVLQIRRAHAERSESVDAATSHLLGIARIQEHDLGDPAAAFDSAREAFLMDPRRVDTRDEVERLGLSLDRDAELLMVWRRALDSERAPDQDPMLRIQLTRRVAELLDERLDDPAGARDAYAALVELDPPDLDLAHRSAQALCRLLLESGEFAALVPAKRTLLRFASETKDQVRIKLEIADLQLGQLRDRVEAAATWAEILDLEPRQEQALDGLERLFASEQEWASLCRVLEHRIHVGDEPSAKAGLWRRLGELRRDRLDDTSGATEAFHSVVELSPESDDAVAALRALIAISRERESWGDVEDGLRRLERLIDAPRDQADIRLELAEVVGKALGRGADALELLKIVLDAFPGDSKARSSARAYVDDEDTRERAIEILTPLFEAEQNWAALLELQEIHARQQPSGGRRLEALLHVADTHEARLRSPARAFSVLCAALSEAVDQPGLAAVLDRLDELGRGDDQAEPLLQAYASNVDRILDSQLQRRVQRSIGEVALKRLGRLDRARAAYERLLELSPDEDAADALEQIYQRSEDYEALIGLLTRRAERDTDETRRDTYLIRAANIALDKRDAPENAILLFERLSVAGLAREEVQAVIDPLYEQTGRYAELATFLNHKLSRLSGKDLVETHLRIGRLYGEKLGDPEEGVRHLSAALRLDPDHAVATDDLNRYLDDPTMRTRVIEMLEPVFVAVSDWARLIRIHEIKLASAESEDAQVRTLLRIAQLYEEQLEDLDQALDGYARVFARQPGNAYVRDQMHRLSSVLRKLDRYAEFLAKYLDGDDGQEDNDANLGIAREAADVWASTLKQPAKAVPLYRRLVDARYGGEEVFASLETALVAAEQWPELLTAYWNEVDASLDEDRQVTLLMRLAMTALHSVGDREQAVAAFRAVLERRPSLDRARMELETIYRDDQRFGDLLDLLRDRLDRTEGAQPRATIHLAIAELQFGVLADPTGAVDTLEVLLGETPNDPNAIRTLEAIAEEHPDQRQRIYGTLEPIYRAEHDLPKLITVTEWRLKIAEEPALRHDLYRRLARHIEAGKGGPEQAFRTLVRALGEAGPIDALHDLDREVTRLADQLSMPEALANALISSADAPGLVHDTDRRLDLMVRGARLHLDAGEPEKAVEVLRTGLTLGEADEHLLSLLDDGLVRLGYHEELASVLAKRADVVSDARERAELLRRLARLHEEVLARPDQAEQTWRELLDVEPADVEALKRLSLAYEASGSTGELISVLERRIDATGDAAERRELRMRLAAVYREAAKDRESEIEVLCALLGEVPADDAAMGALSRALQAEGRAAEAVDVIQERATMAATDERKAALILEAARVYANELEDRVGSMTHYEAVLQLVPGQEGAISDLVELSQQRDVFDVAAGLVSPQLEAEGRYAEQARVLAARIRFVDDGVERSRLSGDLAVIFHDKLSDPSAALDAILSSLGDATVETLSDAVARAMRLAADADRVDDLVGALREQAQQTARDPELRAAFALAAADAEITLRGDRRGALDNLAPLLDDYIADRNVLERIETLARAVGDAAMVARALDEATRREATDDGRAEAFVRLGDVRVDLEEIEAAADAYCEALELVSGLPTAVAGLELVLERLEGATQLRAIDHLETAYEADGNLSALAALCRIKLRAADPVTRGKLLHQLATLCEDGGGTPAEALDAWGDLLALDPGAVEVRERLLSLAHARSMVAQAVAAMEQAIERGYDDGRSVVTLSLCAARTALDELKEAPRAINLLERVLDGDPTHADALEL
ncbi:MAG: tetratricopeptide repeat protein, partial [Myxococcales bacterium FL481]